jgi:glycosyltransferase involved in cell wall biosynthesis
MHPKFTIVTCTRNSMATLPQTIRSVQAQHFRDYEHLFVDGNSTDGTLEYLRGLSGNLRVIEGVTGGISRAMNVGIQEARGDFIAHLHSDDYYASPEVLGIVALTLESTGARWLFGRCLSDIDGQIVGAHHAQIPYSYARLLKRNFIPHPATFVARSLFGECGDFKPQIRYAMDYDLWLRLGAVADPVQLDTELAVFRVHDGSLSSANKLEAFEDDYRVRLSHIGKAPWVHLQHWLRYLVRRHRLLAVEVQVGK